MQQHVMMSAQQHPVVDIRTAAVALPLVNMMSFTPRWRPITTRKHASAVPRGERDALAGREQALCTPDIEWTIFVEQDRDEPRGADKTFSRVNRDACALTFDARDASHPSPAGHPASLSLQLGKLHDDVHFGRAAAEHRTFVCVRGDLHQVNERIKRDLFGRAGVSDEPIRARHLERVNKARTTAPR